MQVLTVHNNQADLLTYSNLFNKNQICERLTASNMPCQKLDKITPISQQLTRENSKDNLSQDDVDYSYTDKAANFLDNDHKSQSKPQSDQEPTPSFPQRSNDEARMSYINKLVNMKILNLKPKKKSQNVFVFDWDDTLFCTSSVGNLPLTRMPVHMRPSMQNLDATASQLLLKASQSGDVFIITNSDKGWVEQSSRQALPRTYQVIVRRNVQIISARKDYGERYPNDMYRWKLEAFLSLKRQFEDDIMTNLVVLGDSELEIRAANALGSQFKQCLVKTVKFKGGPKIEELIKQQNIITSLFDDIFTSCKGMTVKLGK